MHAGAIEWRDRVVLLPGVSNAGKSTLVAGLVRAGARYLTDEAACLDHETLVVRPFPKAIALDPGSFPLFEPARPVVDPALIPVPAGTRTIVLLPASDGSRPAATLGCYAEVEGAALRVLTGVEAPVPG